MNLYNCSMTKKCSKCQETKTSNEFYRNVRTATGLTSYCKVCTKMSVRDWKENNPDWRKPEYDERYRSKNRERDAARAAEWSRTHRANRNATQQSRRAREFNGGNYSPEDWISLCEIYGSVCLSCGSDKITVDHVIPLIKGGSNTIDNLQPLCQPCNSSKGSKIIDYRKSLVS